MANAYVDSQFTTSEQFFVASGYSREMARIAKLTTRDPNGIITPNYDNRTTLQLIYDYIDPCSSTDTKFPIHSINYSRNEALDYYGNIFRDL